MGLETELRAIDGAALTLVVAQALGDRSAVVQDWRGEPLAGGIGVALGANTLHRFAGTARVGDGVRPWSLVLKVLRPPSADEGAPDLTHPDYWKREALVYRSGLLDGLPDGLAAPRCYGVVERAEGTWLWLEAVADRFDVRWPLATFGDAARHFGRLNGAYLAGRPLPAVPWLSRSVLRPRIAATAALWERYDDLRDRPLFRRGWPGGLAGRARRVWADRDRFAAALEALPRVLRHGDADRRNLFARRTAHGSPETVAIDWAAVGPGPVGDEAATLVAASVLWAQGVGPADLPELSRTCFGGYLAGLRDAGWAGEERPVRLGYAATLGLRWGPLAGITVAVTADADWRARTEAALGISFEEMLDRYARMQPFLLAQADEARRLLGPS